MLKDSIVIERDPDAVWVVLTDPSQLPRWNPKVIAVEPRSPGSFRKGYRYRVTYRMSGENAVMQEVDVFEPPARLEIRVTGGRMPANGVVHERYTLRRLPAGTEVVQLIDMRQSGIPWLWRVIMAVLQRIGRPTGKRYLENLKSLVESK